MSTLQELSQIVKQLEQRLAVLEMQVRNDSTVLGNLQNSGMAHAVNPYEIYNCIYDDDVDKKAYDQIRQQQYNLIQIDTPKELRKIIEDIFNWKDLSNYKPEQIELARQALENLKLKYPIFAEDYQWAEHMRIRFASEHNVPLGDAPIKSAKDWYFIYYQKLPEQQDPIKDYYNKAAKNTQSLPALVKIKEACAKFDPDHWTTTDQEELDALKEKQKYFMVQQEKEVEQVLKNHKPIDLTVERKKVEEQQQKQSILGKILQHTEHTQLKELTQEDIENAKQLIKEFEEINGPAENKAEEKEESSNSPIPYDQV